MRSLASNHWSRFALQLCFDRPNLIRSGIGDMRAGIHPLLLPEKPEPELLLRSFSPSILGRSSRFHFRMIREFQTNNFHVLLLTWFDLELGRNRENPRSQKQSTAARIRVTETQFFKNRDSTPKLLNLLQVGPRALCWCDKVQTGPSARCRMAPPCCLKSKSAFQSFFLQLPLTSRPRTPFCTKFTHNLHFSIFLHKNQKHIKVCKFLVFFYIKDMQKGSKI